MAKGLSAAKAKKMLEDGRVRGTALTEKQKKLFGAVAGGATLLKAINGGWLDKFEDGGSLHKAQGGDNDAPLPTAKEKMEKEMKEKEQKDKEEARKRKEEADRIKEDEARTLKTVLE